MEGQTSKTLDTLTSNFTDELIAGLNPDIAKYLDQCPAEERAELAETLDFIIFVKQHMDEILKEEKRRC